MEKSAHRWSERSLKEVPVSVEKRRWTPRDEALTEIMVLDK